MVHQILSIILILMAFDVLFTRSYENRCEDTNGVTDPHLLSPNAFDGLTYYQAMILKQSTTPLSMSLAGHHEIQFTVDLSYGTDMEVEIGSVAVFNVYNMDTVELERIDATDRVTRVTDGPGEATNGRFFIDFWPSTKTKKLRITLKPRTTSVSVKFNLDIRGCFDVLPTSTTTSTVPLTTPESSTLPHATAFHSDASPTRHPANRSSNTTVSPLTTRSTTTTTIPPTTGITTVISPTTITTTVPPTTSITTDSPPTTRTTTTIPPTTTTTTSSRTTIPPSTTTSSTNTTTIPPSTTRTTFTTTRSPTTRTTSTTTRSPTVRYTTTTTIPPTTSITTVVPSTTRTTTTTIIPPTTGITTDIPPTTRTTTTIPPTTTAITSSRTTIPPLTTTSSTTTTTIPPSTTRTTFTTTRSPTTRTTSTTTRSPSIRTVTIPPTTGITTVIPPITRTTTTKTIPPATSITTDSPPTTRTTTTTTIPPTTTTTTTTSSTTTITIPPPTTTSSTNTTTIPPSTTRTTFTTTRSPTTRTTSTATRSPTVRTVTPSSSYPNVGFTTPTNSNIQVTETTPATTDTYEELEGNATLCQNITEPSLEETTTTCETTSTSNGSLTADSVEREETTVCRTLNISYPIITETITTTTTISTSTTVVPLNATRPGDEKCEAMGGECIEKPICEGGKFRLNLCAGDKNRRCCVKDDPKPEKFDLYSREDWKSKVKRCVHNIINLPVSKVFIHHTEGSACFNKADCMKKVRSTQTYHLKKKDKKGKNWKDIGYSFLVGEDGNAYEGRGWNAEGAHTPNNNRISIAICVIGNFMTRLPNQKALNTVKNLIEYGVANKKISKNYRLFGHKDVWKTDCPGNKLYALIKTWPRYGKK